MTPAARYYRLGLMILAAGLLAAAVVVATTQPRSYESGTAVYEMDGDKPSAVDPADLKRYQQDTWSRANAATAEGLRWIISWCHGRRLATTLVVLSAGGFLVCCFLANFEFQVAPPPRGTRDPDSGP